jgi:hypothetical protein
MFSCLQCDFSPAQLPFGTGIDLGILAKVPVIPKGF